MTLSDPFSTIRSSRRPDRCRRVSLLSVLARPAAVVAMIALLLSLPVRRSEGDELPAETRPAAMVRADLLHLEGITGRGITIAVVDGAPQALPEIPRAGDGHERLLGIFDPIADQLLPEDSLPAEVDDVGDAESEMGVMLSSRQDAQGRYAGVAPNADLVVVSALGSDGTGRIADVIHGIGWVIANRDRFGIRVLQLSLASEAGPGYWDDPLNRAVMAAWRAGIVVVAAAGNGGPAPASVVAPANVPYVVTVGAAGRLAEDELVVPYSAAGPTAEGLVKPEILAPGGAVAGSEGEPEAAAAEGSLRRVIAGTSISAAVVSGVVALILEADPWLTPDQVKHRLLASGRPAVGPDGDPAYPVLRQGAGLVDAFAAARSDSTAAANRGLDVEVDLAGPLQFHGGSSDLDFDLHPELPDDLHDGSNGLLWSDRPTAAAGYTWPDHP